MHGVDESYMTGAQGTQVVNGNTGPGTPPAATQVNSASIGPNKAGTVVTGTPINASITNANLNLGQQSGSVLNIMSRPASVATASQNGMPVSMPLQPGMQIISMRPNQSLQMTAGRGIQQRMIVNPVTLRPGQPGQPITLQTIQGLPPGTQGHLIIKTDNGQLQLVRVNNAQATASPGQISANGTQTTTNSMVVQQTPNNAFRFQQPQTQTVVAVPNSAVTTTAAPTVAGGGQIVIVPSSSVAVSSTSSSIVAAAAVGSTNITSTASPAAVGTQTISAESAKTKCKNFLATLLRLASEQRAKVAQNVRNLIQGLIDGKVEPEAFTEELQKDLNSSPQPCLVPFLKKTLPYLRTSLARGELTIEGVRPPPLSAVVPVTGMTTVIPSMLIKPTVPVSSGPIRVVNPSASGTLIHRPVSSMANQVTPSPRLITQVQQVRLGNKLVTALKPPSASSNSTTLVGVSSTAATINNSKFLSKLSSKDDKKKEKTVAFNAGDDDINDVAAMGGVNLGEESQRILDSTGFVGTQIRSCKDEIFLAANPLLNKMRQITSEYDLDEPGKDVVTIVSHAVQERLKTIIEKLGVIAEHRLDLLKTEPRYEVLQDVKGQLRFLEELDKMEKKRKDEQERELLLRAAKSRSKSEDPEQAKLKAKAKEMQRVEMEEMRQRDANVTALKALQGPRKKPKLDLGGEESSTYSGTFTQKQMLLRPRIKRVTLRDLLFLMEQEKDLNKSNLLYRTHLK